MGSIKSDLICEGGRNLSGEYPGVYADLETKKQAKPAKAADKISPKELGDHLRVIIGELVKAEIDTDPAGVGYLGGSSAQIADLMNVPIGKNVARVSVILTGIPFAPNILTASDITEARKP